MEEGIRTKNLRLLDQHRIMTLATLPPDGWPLKIRDSACLKRTCLISRHWQPPVRSDCLNSPGFSRARGTP